VLRLALYDPAGFEIVHGEVVPSKPPLTIAAAVHVDFCVDTVVNVVPSVVVVVVPTKLVTVVGTKLVTVETRLIVVAMVVVPGIRCVSTTVVEIV
jgi:hypothetical protein